MKDVDSLQVAAATIYGALLLLYVGMARNVRRQSWRIVGRPIGSVLWLVAIAVSVHFAALVIMCLVPQDLSRQPPVWLVAVWALEESGLVFGVAGTRHASFVVRGDRKIPGWSWLVGNYAPAVALSVLSVVFPVVFREPIVDAFRHYVLLRHLAITTWWALALFELPRAYNAATWRPGFSVTRVGRGDVISLGLAVVALVLIIPMVALGGEPGWLSLMVDASVRFLILLPTFARFRGELTRWFVIFAGVTLIAAATVFMTTALRTSLANLGLHRLADVLTIVAVLAVAMTARPRMQGVVDRMLLGGQRRRWDELQSMVRGLPVDEGVSSCCRHFADAVVASRVVDGIAVVLEGGIVVTAGEVQGGPLHGLWPWSPRTRPPSGTGTVLPDDVPFPPGVVTALALARVDTVVEVASPRRSWGCLCLGAAPRATLFAEEDERQAAHLGAQLGLVLDAAILVEGLRDASDALDAKVRLRTAELERANTELSTAYDRLTHAQQQLVQTEKMAALGQLVAGVAHEINNPVSFIVGNIEPLSEEVGRLRELVVHDDPEVRAVTDRIQRICDTIARGAHRTSDIVQDLRTFSRVRDVTPSLMDVGQAIEVSLRLLRRRWADRIVVHYPADTLPLIEAVAGQVNQVVMNLLANACDAIEERGNIWIDAAVTDGWLQVAIRDDGVGIPASDVDRVFDPFFTTKPPGKGTGLGLAVSHEIVAQHGGSLTVVSDPGHGTTFTLRLPTRYRGGPLS